MPRKDKEATKAYLQEWRKRNPLKTREYAKRDRETMSPERRSRKTECDRRYRDENRDAIAEKRRSSYRANSAPAIARATLWSKTDAGRSSKIAAARKWQRKNPEKAAAHSAVGRAIKAGKLIPQPCEVCGATEGVDAHHDDYGRKLDVRWLCRKHHKQQHADSKPPVTSGAASA